MVFCVAGQFILIWNLRDAYVVQWWCAKCLDLYATCCGFKSDRHWNLFVVSGKHVLFTGLLRLVFSLMIRIESSKIHEYLKIYESLKIHESPRIYKSPRIYEFRKLYESSKIRESKRLIYLSIKNHISPEIRKSLEVYDFQNS